MKISYTHPEAREYLGVSYETFRQLVAKYKIQSQTNPDDHRTKIFSAADIERLKFELNRSKRTDIITVLNSDLAPNFCESLVDKLTNYLEERIAIVTFPGSATNTAITRFPMKPTRRRVKVDLYRVTLTPEERPPSFLLLWERTHEWLTSLTQKYPKVIVQLETNSLLTDHIIQSSSCVILVLNKFTHPDSTRIIKEAEQRIYLANRLQHGPIIRFDSIVLAGKTGKYDDLKTARRIRNRLSHKVIVSVESRAAFELMQFWYAGKAKEAAETAPSPASSIVTAR